MKQTGSLVSLFSSMEKGVNMALPDIDSIPDTGAVFTLGKSRFADNIPSHFFIRKDPVVSIDCGDEHSAVVCVLKPEKVSQVACGRAHTLICTENQKIFACGSDQESQLGRGQQTVGDSSSSPVLIYDCGLAGAKIVEIAAGSHHSLALISDGTVLAWGSNLEGQLGLPGTSGLVNKPTKVQIPETVKQISAGYYHSAFLTENGNVFVCGEAESGKLGISLDFRTQVAPKQMQLSVPAVSVACGGHHTLILAEDGNIYCTGSNSSGQLGMGSDVTELQTPKQLPRGALQDETIKKISCGESHIAILTASGKLFTCGDGRHGKLGLEENENNVHELTFANKYEELLVTDVSCGGCHTIFTGQRIKETNEDSESRQMKINPLPPLKVPSARSIPRDLKVDDQIDEPEKGENEPSEKESLEEAAEKKSEHEESISLTQVEKPASPKKLPEYEAPKSPESHLSNEKMETDADVTKDEPEMNLNDDEEKEQKGPIEAGDRPTSSDSKVSSKKLEKEQVENGEDTSVEKPASPPLPTPPPKPPRQKIGSGNSQESRRGSEEKSSSKNPSATSKNGSAKSSSQNGSAKSASQKGSAKSASQNGSDKVASMENEKVDENTEKTTAKEPENPFDVNDGGGDDEDDNCDVKSEKKSVSSGKSQVRSVDTGETIAVESKIENCIEKIEDFTDKTIQEVENKIDQIADDAADVIQSPVARAGKIAKLFKNKKQDVENGNKIDGSPPPKTKSKTCTIL